MLQVILLVHPMQQSFTHCHMMWLLICFSCRWFLNTAHCFSDVLQYRLIQWPWDLQLKKTHTNIQNTSKPRKHFYLFDNTFCKTVPGWRWKSAKTNTCITMNRTHCKHRKAASCGKRECFQGTLKRDEHGWDMHIVAMVTHEVTEVNCPVMVLQNELKCRFLFLMILRYLLFSLQYFCVWLFSGFAVQFLTLQRCRQTSEDAFCFF